MEIYSRKRMRNLKFPSFRVAFLSMHQGIYGILDEAFCIETPLVALSGIIGACPSAPRSQLKTRNTDDPADEP
jgi:hypothetical protein